MSDYRMDEIRIDELEIYAHHGVFPEENEKGQHFYVNAVLYTDTRAAGEQDELELSTHYGYVCEEIRRVMTEHTWNLIESVAEHTAEAVLLKFPLILALDLEIRKPQAPIPMKFESVSVKIHRGWHRVYVAVGANLGDQEKTIRSAVEKLGQDEKIRNIRMSGLIRTTPYGVTDQPEFVNGVVELQTLYTPHQLLRELNRLESEAGRVREQHWGPRTLDLDILLYDDDILHDGQLDIPHIDMQNREFVLAPLAELNPVVRHPVCQKTAAELLQLLRERRVREGCIIQKQ